MGECGLSILDCSLTVADLIAFRMPEDDHEDAFWCPLSRLLCGTSIFTGFASSKSSNVQRSLRTVSECLRLCPCGRRVSISLFRGVSGLKGCSFANLNDLGSVFPRLALLGNPGADRVSCFLTSNEKPLSVLSLASRACSCLL